MNESLGMAKTTEELFSQLDLIGKKLENFSLTIDKKRDDVFNLLRQFGQGIQQDFSASGQVTDGTALRRLCNRPFFKSKILLISGMRP